MGDAALAADQASGARRCESEYVCLPVCTLYPSRCAILGTSTLFAAVGVRISIVEAWYSSGFRCLGQATVQ